MFPFQNCAWRPAIRISTGARYFSLPPKWPDQLWGPPSLVFDLYWGLPAPSTEVKNGWNSSFPMYVNMVCIGTTATSTFTLFHLPNSATVWGNSTVPPGTLSGPFPAHKCVSRQVAEVIQPTRHSSLHSKSIRLQDEGGVRTSVQGYKRNSCNSGIDFFYTTRRNYARFEVLIQRCWYRFESFGIYRCVDWYKCTDVSEEHSASTFRILDYLSVKMEALHSFETSVPIYPTSRRHEFSTRNYSIDLYNPTAHADKETHLNM